MNRNAIRWVVVLMSFSLISLVVFQFYWIDGVIKNNKALFKRDVQEALTHVVNMLEKQEALHFAVDNFHTQFVWKTHSSDRPGEIELIESTFEKKVVEINDFMKDSIKQPLGLSFYFDTDTKNFDLEAEVVKNKDNLKTDKNKVLVFDEDSTKLSEKEIAYKTQLKKIAKKSEYLQVAIHELVSGNKPIRTRLDPDKLDSLLQISLLDHGIDIAYQFGVIDPIDNDMFIKRVTHSLPNLASTDMRVNMYPNDIIGEAGFLLIDFPEQQSFLLKKIWFTLASSVVLIFVIIFCFAYAIITIFRQKQLSDIKNDFINNMTHEFKTPISTVSLACEALSDKEIRATAGLEERYLKIIHDENKRLGLQVEKVLQMAVIERKDFDLKLERVDLHLIIEEAMENIAIQVVKKGGIISKDLKAVKQSVNADQMHLTNIVYNLLDNANKYSPEKPNIKISTKDSAKGININILDQGIGMSKEVLTKIFEKFYRVPTGNLHDVKGFGLGLSYVKNMVEAHGGEIKVKSELNKGSSFNIFLPYQPSVQ